VSTHRILEENLVTAERRFVCCDKRSAWWWVLQLEVRVGNCEKAAKKDEGLEEHRG